MKFKMSELATLTEVLPSDWVLDTAPHPQPLNSCRVLDAAGVWVGDVGSYRIQRIIGLREECLDRLRSGQLEAAKKSVSDLRLATGETPATAALEAKIARAEIMLAGGVKS